MNFGTGDVASVEAPKEAASEHAVEQTIAPDVDAPQVTATDDSPTDESFAVSEFGQELKVVYAQSDPEQSDAELRAEFGPQYDSNRQLASGFAQIDGFADAQRVLEVAGVVNHPAIMRFLMNAGRVHYTTKSEDGGQQSLQTQDGFDEALETLRERQQEARSKGSSRKADELYRKEMALIAR